VHNSAIWVVDFQAWGYKITPTPWLTLLLVLGKNCVNRILCQANYVKSGNNILSKIRVSEGISVS
jgi:hypothetical protein